MSAVKDSVSSAVKAIENKEKRVASPCVSICTLNQEDICQGCYRSVSEITQWFGLDDEARKKVLKMAEKRARDAGSYF